MKRNKKRIKPSIIVLACLILLCLFILFIWPKHSKEIYMVDLTNYGVKEIKQYSLINKLKLKIEYAYSDTIAKDKVIEQSIKEDALLSKDNKLTVVISLGPIPTAIFKQNKVNELGSVPIMMYHGIHNLKNDDTAYTGGNVDRDGYNRTTEAFINDLEMYYKKGYRMMRLQDYINGDIKVELGKSPIILTFDDGNSNNVKILGKDEKGNLLIDPNSAIGILESFKKKYKDYNVTATFFLTHSLFGQPKYNEEIVKWLIDNGYDIGNHTGDHINLSKVSTPEVISNITYMYQLFDKIIPEKYVKIIALPNGQPTNKNNPNFLSILDGTSNGYHYSTEATLRVGWMPEYSPYDVRFDKTYLMRVRAWDNNGKDDIEMHFKNLENNKYISSGNDNFIVIPKSKVSRIKNEINKKIITYE